MSSENEIPKKANPFVMFLKYGISILLFLFLAFIIFNNTNNKAVDKQIAESVKNADGNSEFISVEKAYKEPKT